MDIPIFVPPYIYIYKYIYTYVIFYNGILLRDIEIII